MVQINSLPSKPIQIKSIPRDTEKFYGLFIAFSIITVWVVSLIFLLSTHISHFSIGLIVPAMVWQTFLYTGLFITAHDAMHGVVYQSDLKLNHAVGKLSVLLFGLFSYKHLLTKHWLHHRHPASELDPDFHDNEHKHPLMWYFHFMKGYWSWKQILGLIVAFIVIRFGFHVSTVNLVLFWGLPTILSSIQLFYFGTFLTHREPDGGYTNPHRAQTSPYSEFWSFISCYHFGYHLEHHEHPDVPWWQLPAVYKMRTHS